jgi:hypothetical protein
VTKVNEAAGLRTPENDFKFNIHNKEKAFDKIDKNTFMFYYQKS